MKYFIVLIVFAIFSQITALAQNDSLEYLARNGTNIQKIKSLNSLSVQFRKSDSKKSYDYALQANKLSKIENLAEEEILSLLNISIYHKSKRDSNNFIKTYNEIFPLIAKIEPARLPFVYNNIAQAFIVLANQDSTMHYAQKAYKSLPQKSDDSSYLNVHLAYANALRVSGKYNESLDAYQNLIKLAESKDKLMAAWALSNMAMIYKDWKQFDAAAKLIAKSIKQIMPLLDDPKYSSRKIEIYGMLFNSYNNLSINYNYSNQVENAKDALLLAYQFAVLSGSDLSIAQVTTNLGNIFEAAGKLDSALIFFNRSMELSRKVNSVEGIAINYANIGYVQFRQKDFSSAGKNLLASYNLVNQNNLHYLQPAVVTFLIDLYEATKNYKKAFEYQKILTELKDKKGNNESEVKISELRNKYEKARQLLEQNEIDRQKRFEILIAIGVLIVILMAIVFFVIRFRSKSKSIKILNEKNQEITDINHQLGESNTKLQNLVATKDKFFSIISHDLRNPFSTIINIGDMLHSMFDELDEKDKRELINDLKVSSRRVFSLLENLLTWSRSQRGLIEFNPEKINLYMLFDNSISSVQSMAISKEITIVNKVDHSITAKFDTNQIAAVIRNILSNSVKFTNRNGKIELDAAINNGILLLSIQDNGVGMAPEDLDKLFRIDVSVTTIGTGNEKGTGLGLIICQEFVAMHKGKIWAESTPGEGSTFYIELPIID